jgi:hypothetical protein
MSCMMLIMPDLFEDYTLRKRAHVTPGYSCTQNSHTRDDSHCSRADQRECSRYRIRRTWLRKPIVVIEIACTFLSLSLFLSCRTFLDRRARLREIKRAWREFGVAPSSGIVVGCRLGYITVDVKYQWITFRPFPPFPISINGWPHLTNEFMSQMVKATSHSRAVHSPSTASRLRSASSILLGVRLRPASSNDCEGKTRVFSHSGPGCCGALCYLRLRCIMTAEVSDSRPVCASPCLPYSRAPLRNANASHWTSGITILRDFFCFSPVRPVSLCSALLFRVCF